MGTFLAVQWLRLCACKAEDVGSISGHGLRSYMPHFTTKSRVGGIFTNRILNKGLIPKYTKNSVNSTKTTKRSKQSFLKWQMSWTDIPPKLTQNGQQTHEKMLNITNHQGKARGKHDEISAHIYQNSRHKEDKRQQGCWGCGKGEPWYLLGRNVNWNYTLKEMQEFLKN